MRDLPSFLSGTHARSAHQGLVVRASFRGCERATDDECGSGKRSRTKLPAHGQLHRHRSTPGSRLAGHRAAPPPARRLPRHRHRVRHFRGTPGASDRPHRAPVQGHPSSAARSGRPAATVTPPRSARVSSLSTQEGAATENASRARPAFRRGRQDRYRFHERGAESFAPRPRACAPVRRRRQRLVSCRLLPAVRRSRRDRASR